MKSNRLSHLSKIIFSIVSLILIGFYYLSTATGHESLSSFNDTWYYPKRQLLWLFVSALLGYLSFRIPNSTIYKYATPFYLLTILSLVLVLVPGIGHKAFGAQRWISIFGFTIQPLEFFKLASCLYFAKVFSMTKNINILQLGIALGTPTLLLLLQPNMSGASLVTATTILLFLDSNQPKKTLLIFSLTCLVLGMILILTSPYRLARLMSLSSENISYHAKQTQIAVQNGGLFGVGLGNSEQKYKFIPQLAKDSIASVIVEETGVMGLLGVSFIFVYLFYLIIKLPAGSEFEHLLMLGLGLWIVLQAIINLASITGLIPLTGVPLPFISYGGSSMASLGIATGRILHQCKKVS